MSKAKGPKYINRIVCPCCGGKGKEYYRVILRTTKPDQQGVIELNELVCSMCLGHGTILLATAYPIQLNEVLPPDLYAYSIDAEGKPNNG